MDGKKVILIGGGAGIGRSVREVMALAALEDSGVHVVGYGPGREEDKEIIDQLNSIVERERVIQSEPYVIEKIPRCEMLFNPNQKIRSKYKRNLKYR